MLACAFARICRALQAVGHSLIACTIPDICHLWRRKQHGDFFGITVSGYPEAHPDVISEDKDQQEKAYRADLQYLKQKVKA